MDFFIDIIESTAMFLETKAKFFMSINNKDEVLDKLISYYDFVFTNFSVDTNMYYIYNENLDIGKLAIFRLKIRNDFGAMWLSDYIDNGYIKDVRL